MPTRPGFWITPKEGLWTRCRLRHTGFASTGYMIPISSSNFSNISSR